MSHRTRHPAGAQISVNPILLNVTNLTRIVGWNDADLGAGYQRQKESDHETPDGRHWLEHDHPSRSLSDLVNGHRRLRTTDDLKSLSSSDVTAILAYSVSWHIPIDP